MEKKLQDYLHYYMGCTFWTNNSEGEVNPETIRFIYPMIEKRNNVQLHLRRLEDMTEEEKKECDKQVHKYDTGNGRSHFITDWAYRVDWLLKQHFDLFGLVDAGLAIDAKTINS
jgi:hypothetical protein